MLKIIPLPDIAIFLDVDPDVAFRRKPEYPPEFYIERRQAYSIIFKSISSRYIVNSDGVFSAQSKIQRIFRDLQTRIRLDKYSSYVDFTTKSLFNGLQKVEVPGGFNFDDLVLVLRKNRIVTRWVQVMYSQLNEEIKNKIAPIIDKEKIRLKKAIEGIGKVTREFNKRGYHLLVIKTLDNYPDLGHDIDLYTDAPIVDIDEIFINKFKAKLQPPTFADRLSRKRNYKIDSYGTFEVHCSRLGELGEDNLLAQDLILNGVKIEIGGVAVFVPKPEYRLLLCVLQRIYRHFNVRICDVFNTINQINGGEIDWIYLQNVSKRYGIWRGVLLYLSYIKKIADYYNIKLEINQSLIVRNWPAAVKDRNMHFRFPLFYTGMNVYWSKIVSDIVHLNFHSLFRIPLVVPLSLIHYCSVKLTGKDGIW